MVAVIVADALMDPNEGEKGVGTMCCLSLITGMHGAGLLLNFFAVRTCMLNLR